LHIKFKQVEKDAKQKEERRIAKLMSEFVFDEIYFPVKFINQILVKMLSDESYSKPCKAYLQTI
jgi:hypothetical protein